MKILGFAHVTFCLSTRQKYLGNHLFGKTLNYEGIENNPSKFLLMEFEDRLHYISLPAPGIEICLYDSAALTSLWHMREIVSYLSIDREGNCNIKFSLNNSLKRFLSSRGKLIEGQSALKLAASPFMRTISFSKDTDGATPFRTNRFLDTPGIVSLAFFVDSMLSEIECEREEIEHFEPFPVNFVDRGFVVQILKIEGVNIELICRPDTN